MSPSTEICPSCETPAGLWNDGVLQCRTCGFGLRLRPGDQPLPTPNDLPDIQSLVIEDVRQRRLVGIARYGTPLQPFNRRDALRDAYEESLDLAMYLKQELVERDLKRQAGPES